MKNQSKNFLQFESERKPKSNSLMASTGTPCVEYLTTQYLYSSAQRAMSSRVNTPTPYNSTKICANLAFDFYPSFECKLYSYLPTPFPIDGELLQYQGIKSIRVEVEGFSLISTEPSQEIYLQPGKTYEYPFNGNQFFIAFRRQGVYPIPTVYVVVEHTIDYTTPPISPYCINTEFNAEIRVNVHANGDDYLINMPVGFTQGYIDKYGVAFEGPID